MTAIPNATLRVWERRYGFPRPTRDAAGIRNYTADDIETLKLISHALACGYRPNEVVGKDRASLLKMLTASSATPRAATGSTPAVEPLIDCLLRDDLTTLRAELRRAAVALGPTRFVVEVAQPISEKVGELWAAKRLEVRHEHVLTECLSAQLAILLSAYEDRIGAPRVVLASLPNERHGLGLEMVAVYLAAAHVTPILIGVETPPDQIVEAALHHAARAVGVVVTRAADRRSTTKHLRAIVAKLPRRARLWIGGAGGADLAFRAEKTTLVRTWAELDRAVAALG